MCLAFLHAHDDRFDIGSRGARLDFDASLGERLSQKKTHVPCKDMAVNRLRVAKRGAADKPNVFDIASIVIVVEVLDETKGLSLRTTFCMCSRVWTEQLVRLVDDDALDTTADINEQSRATGDDDNVRLEQGVRNLALRSAVEQGD